MDHSPHASHDHDHAHDDHGHDHDHGHSHALARDADRRYLAAALALLLGFTAVEVVVGLIAGSLALISDAGHLLTDAAAIALALWAMHLAGRPAAGSYTFGLKRAEILSAQVNGLSLLLLSVWFIVEAVIRLVTPPRVDGELVTVVATAGIFVNLAAVWVMSKANRQSLNVEGSFQHILTDLYAFIATALAGALVWWTGWNRIDSIAALVVAGLMFKAGYALVRDSGRVFLEAAPRGLEPAAIAEAMRAVEGVTAVEDLHVWEVTSGLPALSAHLFVSRALDCHATRRQVQAMLVDRFAIRHATLQTDHADEGEPGHRRDAPCAFSHAH
ncbi:MAG TPA: cation diffusion facilitator family transporter [Dyella sp.]|nr:cation diffusion facilitator family transporter [Dyella sp.]